MATLKNTAHLKTGNHFSDPHHTAKVQGVNYSGTAKHVERHKTPSNSRPVDGNLGDDADDKGNGMWRDMDKVTQRHTYTTDARGSTCGDDASD